MKGIIRVYIPAVTGLLLGLAACGGKDVPEDEVQAIGTTPCKGQTAFIAKTGLDNRVAAMSTSEVRIKSLAVIEVGDAPTHRTWVHPSWAQYGTMGPLAVDEQGNVYVAAIPMIDVINRSGPQQNTIYKVESSTGEMKPYLTLPGADSSSDENPYGILGLYYDCYAQKLFVSSVAGSTRRQENGRLFCIDLSSGKVVDELDQADAIGLASSGASGKYCLYFGSARSPAIYAVSLDKEGHFKGRPAPAFSLQNLGPRGDDKARRIRVDKNGDLLVSGIEFNYNLTAPTEKQESTYRFRYSDEAGAWQVQP